MLILDELGFVPFDRTGGELLFNVIADRYERKSVMLTSNLSFSALLDRLADDATVITPKGKSFRMRRRGQTQGASNETKGPPALPAVAPAGNDDKTTKAKAK